MNSSSSAQPPSRNRPAGLWTAGVLLTVVVLLVFTVFAVVGYRGHGTTGVAAAGVAGGTCWAGALIALVLTGLLRRHRQALAGVLAGMFFRLGAPLVVGLWLHQRAGPLAEAGVFGMIMLFYLVTLSTETALAVRLVRAAPAEKGTTKAS